MAYQFKALPDALRAAGAVLVRESKHRVYRLPNGRALVISKTASDWRAEQNMLRDLRRLLRGTP